MGQKELAHSLFAAVRGFYRSRWGAIRKEKGARARNQSRTSWDSERRRNWRARKCVIAMNTRSVCAIDSKRKLRNESAILSTTAIAIGACRLCRMFHFALLK